METGGANGQVVLVAEDEPSILNMVGWTLSQAGYTVLLAGDGAEALEVSRGYAGKIHLLLSDVKMPNVSGPELASVIAEERPGIQIMLMSGYFSGWIPPALKPGLLRKPFLPNDLVGRIRRVLRDSEADGLHLVP